MHAYITQPSPSDVLCGRGSGPNDYEGNIRFSSLCEERKNEYLATNSVAAKTKITNDVIGLISIANGRFLERIKPDWTTRIGLKKKTKAWTVASDKTIMEKVKQTLYQKRDKKKARPPQQLPAIDKEEQ